MFCGSNNRLMLKRIPAHHRQWTDETEAVFVEYMPAADDYECGDCERMWTIFDPEDGL